MRRLNSSSRTRTAVSRPCASAMVDPTASTRASDWKSGKSQKSGTSLTTPLIRSGIRARVPTRLPSGSWIWTSSVSGLLKSSRRADFDFEFTL